MHFFPDTLASAVMAYSRAEWIRTTCFFIPPKVFPVEGSQSCSQRFSKPRSACTEDVQFVASQFDLSQTGEFPVSASEPCVCDKLCFLLRSASPGMILEEQDTGGFCFWWPKRCLCVPLAIPGHPDILQSQPCRSHVSYPQPGQHRVFIKITVYFMPSGSDFNLSVL